MKKGILKHVPDKWFITKKPRLVTNFTNDNGVTIGKGVGIFTNYNNLDRKSVV